ncbi:MAG TPA: tetratricopeptide repeat protein [Burkholderiaceae bacterium]|nr:tetratricopeptide repeat protein [Burkholderiaceae bacterium]HSB99947.1 tetratricopeptide repeat protein [Burkholderiaceae bacterium]
MHRCLRLLGSLVLLAGIAAHGAELTREQALRAADQPDAAMRLAGVERLAEIGLMADADRLLPRLRDDDPRVRDSAGEAMWRIWSRSGDAAIDALFARGIDQMHAGALDDALATFDEIVARKPAFAEGWNKRATIYFLIGENDKSLRDCDEVFKRNPNHFGALAGAGQIHLRLGHLERALEFFKRALQVNPNLEGPAHIVPLLEQHLREQVPPRNTT